MKPKGTVYLVSAGPGDVRLLTLRALDSQARTFSFAYKDYADQNLIKILPLTGVEFIRRLSRHV